MQALLVTLEMVLMELFQLMLPALVVLEFLHRDVQDITTDRFFVVVLEADYQLLHGMGQRCPLKVLNNTVQVVDLLAAVAETLVGRPPP